MNLIKQAFISASVLLCANELKAQQKISYTQIHSNSNFSFTINQNVKGDITNPDAIKKTTGVSNNVFALFSSMDKTKNASNIVRVIKPAHDTFEIGHSETKADFEQTKRWLSMSFNTPKNNGILNTKDLSLVEVDFTTEDSVSSTTKRISLQKHGNALDIYLDQYTRNKISDEITGQKILGSKRVRDKKTIDKTVDNFIKNLTSKTGFLQAEADLHKDVSFGYK